MSWGLQLIGCAGKDGNGSALHAESHTFASQVIQMWKTFLTFLPYGSWWQVAEKNTQKQYDITFVEAMQRLWALVSPDRVIIAAAFTALVVAAVSFITCNFLSNRICCLLPNTTQICDLQFSLRLQMYLKKPG